MEVSNYKILFVAQAFPPYEFSEAIVNAKLVKALIEAGHTVHVISRESEQYYFKSWAPLWEHLKEVVFYVDEKPVSKLRRSIELLLAMLSFRLPLEGIRWAKKAAKMGIDMHKVHHYDLMISRMPASASHLVASKIKQATGLPWIANWNDPTDNIRPLMPHDNPSQAFWINRMVRSIFHQADWNTFPSSYLWEHYNQEILHTKQSKVSIIPHMGIGDFQADKDDSARKGPVKLIHAGNMLANVKASRLLRALGRLKNEDGFAFQFNVFGVIDPKMPDMIRELHLTQEVKIHLPKPYFKMLLELRRHDFLLILEAPYPKGILMLSKLSDYASIQRPIIAISPLSGVVADYLQTYGGGVVLDNQSEEAIYQGLKQVLSNPEELKASPALQQVLSPQEVLKEWEAVFQQVLQRT